MKINFLKRKFYEGLKKNTIANKIVKHSRRGIVDYIVLNNIKKILQPKLSIPIEGEYTVSDKKNRGIISGVENIFTNEIEFRENLNYVYNETDLENFHKIRDSTSLLPCQNNYYSFGDAKIYTGIIVKFKPKKIIEIGSGYSTRNARWAINKYNLKCKIISIDPSPRTPIHQLVDERIESSVVNVSPTVFSQLTSGDILFIDGSHLAFHGTDVTHLILSVLHTIPSGVFIHFHDIYLPMEYPKEIDPLFWNEQYMLAAFLMNNNSYKVFIPTFYLHKKGYLKDQGVSFWIKKQVDCN